jgi:hypothetical protein
MRKIKLGTMALAFSLLAAACSSDSGSAGNIFDPGSDQPPDTNGVLEDFGNGDVDLGDLPDASEAIAGAFDTSGGGTVEINGETITFTSEFCFAGQDDFSIEGAGTTADGTPVWVSINLSQDSREELLDIYDEETMQLLYGDDDPIIDGSLRLDYGVTELFGDPVADDVPAFDAVSDSGNTQVVFEANGNEASGSGTAVDYNNVLGDFDTTFDFTFQASCS